MPTIYIAGDSTAAQKAADRKPETGWGEHLPKLLAPGIAVDNRAINGRSTKSFIAEGRLDGIIRDFRSGDYLFIQFGHNDEKIEDPLRYSDPNTEYRSNLQLFIEAARSRGGFPVLLTSVSRRRFTADGEPDPLAVGAYPQAMREVAEATGTPLLDIFAASQELYRSLGIEDSRRLLLHLAPGEHPNYPEGVTDDTHFSEDGAECIAELIAAALAGCAALAELVRGVGSIAENAAERGAGSCAGNAAVSAGSSAGNAADSGAGSSARNAAVSGAGSSARNAAVSGAGSSARNAAVSGAGSSAGNTAESAAARAKLAGSEHSSNPIPGIPLNLGVRAHDIRHQSLPELVGKLQAYRFNHIQFAVRKSFPESVPALSSLSPGTAAHFGDAFRQAGIRIAVLGCYVNIVATEPAIREQALRDFAAHLRLARDFGASLVGTETGSVGQGYTTDNFTEEAFLKVVDSVRRMVAEAERFGVTVGIEAGQNHPLHSAPLAKRLLELVPSNNLQIILDCANLMSPDNYTRQEEVICEALELLDERIAVIHLKDFDVRDGQIVIVPVGQGRLQFAPILHYMKYKRPHIQGILESTTEEHLPGSIAYLQRLYEEV
ncbi:TIM barrel protein [Paenibacillus tepidiphilus]|uniref:TIM barrel protein n=1 Tax=Paenibacillus tepidiphilus TaxID=2608683 RepID=UPI001EEF8514|nr:TIM barrel protein [Paenibacillus tepidiphilus]